MGNELGRLRLPLWYGSGLQCSKACKTSVAKFYDRVQPRTPKASKRSEPKVQRTTSKQPKVATSYPRFFSPRYGFFNVRDFSVELELETLLDKLAHLLAGLNAHVQEHLSHKKRLRSSL